MFQSDVLAKTLAFNDFVIWPMFSQNVFIFNFHKFGRNNGIDQKDNQSLDIQVYISVILGQVKWFNGVDTRLFSLYTLHKSTPHCCAIHFNNPCSLPYISWLCRFGTKVVWLCDNDVIWRKGAKIINKIQQNLRMPMIKVGSTILLLTCSTFSWSSV